MKATIIALALLLGVISLHTQAESKQKFIDKILASWEGKTTDELLEVWGVPDAEAIILGRTVITYDLEAKKLTFLSAQAVGTCKIHFSLTSDLRIVKYRWNGSPLSCKQVVKDKEFLTPAQTNLVKPEVSAECRRAASYEKWFSCTDSELEAIGP